MWSTGVIHYLMFINILKILTTVIQINPSLFCQICYDKDIKVPYNITTMETM